jgi:23S rRNA pseudouridine2605 synthase
VLREGRNRQIRKMCAAVGTEVTSLHRIAVGDVRLGDEWARRGDAPSALECGGVRALEGDELAALARDVAESVARKRDGAASAAKTRAPPPEGWGKRIRDGR